MFQSIWNIFREPTLVLVKVTLFQILPLKCSVKRFSVLWLRLCEYPVLCGVRLRLAPHSTVGQRNFDIIEMHGATTKMSVKNKAFGTIHVHSVGTSQIRQCSSFSKTKMWIWLRRCIAFLSPRRAGFVPMSVNLRFMMDKVA
jgi:hypothetical protein